MTPVLIVVALLLLLGRKSSASGKAAPHADPAPTAFTLYTVQPGDTLSDVAGRFYGPAWANYVGAQIISDANPGLWTGSDWESLNAGDQFEIPPMDLARAQAAQNEQTQHPGTAD